MLMQREKEGNDDSVQGRERDDFPPPFYFSIFSMVWKRQEMEEKKSLLTWYSHSLVLYLWIIQLSGIGRRQNQGKKTEKKKVEMK